MNVPLTKGCRILPCDLLHRTPFLWLPERSSFWDCCFFVSALLLPSLGFPLGDASDMLPLLMQPFLMQPLLIYFPVLLYWLVWGMILSMLSSQSVSRSCSGSFFLSPSLLFPPLPPLPLPHHLVFPSASGSPSLSLSSHAGSLPALGALTCPHCPLTLSVTGSICISAATSLSYTHSFLSREVGKFSYVNFGRTTAQLGVRGKVDP